MSHEAVDLVHQLFDAAEGATTNGFVGDQAEEALHLVEPGAVSGNEMQVPARTLGKPDFHPRVLMRAVVVHDQMDVELLGHAVLDAPQEGQEFLVSVSWLAIGEHSAAEHVEGGT